MYFTYYSLKSNLIFIHTYNFYIRLLFSSVTAVFFFNTYFHHHWLIFDYHLIFKFLFTFSFRRAPTRSNFKTTLKMFLFTLPISPCNDLLYLSLKNKQTKKKNSILNHFKCFTLAPRLHICYLVNFKI